MHKGLKWHTFKGGPPSFHDGSHLLGDDPYYLVGPTTVAMGKTTKTGELKWRNLPFPLEPPPRLSPAAWMGEIEGKPHLFVFGGKVVDTSCIPDTSEKDKKEQKVRFVQSNKMYACDCNAVVWRSLLVTDPMPEARESPMAARVTNGAIMGFGRTIPEMLKLSDVWLFDSSRARISFPDIDGCTWRRLRCERYAYQETQPAARIETACVTMGKSNQMHEELYMFGGLVGELDSKLADDMWMLKVGEERWRSVAYKGYYPGPRKGAKLMRASETELVLFGGIDKIESKVDTNATQASSTPSSPASRSKRNMTVATEVVAPPSLDVLVFDTQLHIFTRPRIGFLPKEISPLCVTSDRVPALYVGKNSVHGAKKSNGGQAMLRYASPEKAKPKKPAGTLQLSMNDAERILFRTKKEMDELERELESVVEDKQDIRQRIEEVRAAKGDADGARIAHEQIKTLRDSIAFEEHIEGEIMDYLAAEIAGKNDADTVCSQLKRTLAAAESKLFSEDVYDHAQGQETIKDNVLKNVEADMAETYNAHVDEIVRLKSLMILPRFTSVVLPRQNRRSTIQELMKQRRTEFEATNVPESLRPPTNYSVLDSSPEQSPQHSVVQPSVAQPSDATKRTSGAGAGGSAELKQVK